MVAVRNNIRFILNDQDVVLSEVKSSDTLLDYLRLAQRLRGTKEGCAEGDCGACTVLVGRTTDMGLVYESVNACIRFVGSLDGCHVVTVEHLSTKDGSLHPVQQAMVDEHGSQCGFCTPGFVMSMYGLWMRSDHPTIGEIEQALQGNLCRCTGYDPIVKAVQAINRYGSVDQDPLQVERKNISDRLAALNDGVRIDIRYDGDHFVLPADVDDLANVLLENPDATIVAGSTDVGLWVTKFMRDISPAIFTGHLTELHRIETGTDMLTVGAGVTYSEFSKSIKQFYPQLEEFWSRIGGEQVRNMGTIGGNVANGSPIGDTPPVLIALGATVTLRRGNERRVLPVEEFFIDYGKQDREEGDFVESLQIPFPAVDEHFACYKISKRRDEDISSVCGAFRVKVTDGLIDNAVIAFGGMAATPKRAKAAEDALVGKTWSDETIGFAQSALKEDFAPISDMRASAEYRGLVSANLLQRLYLEATGEDVRITREQVA